jgi:transposase
MKVGGVTTELFEAYVEHILGPTLRPGQTVLLDNLSTHKSGRLGKLLAAHACRQWYLPSYSPNFSPVELALTKINVELRWVAARTREALEMVNLQQFRRQQHDVSDDLAAFQ